jgi:hypothetical protein
MYDAGKRRGRLVWENQVQLYRTASIVKEYFTKYIWKLNKSQPLNDFVQV